jgi:putative nucleotidyltransferase with HDIG domain
VEGVFMSNYFKRIQPRLFLIICVWFLVLFAAVFYLVNLFEIQFVEHDHIEHTKRFAYLVSKFTSSKSSASNLQSVLVKLVKGDPDVKKAKLKIKQGRQIKVVASSVKSEVGQLKDLGEESAKVLRTRKPAYEQEGEVLEAYYPIKMGSKTAVLSLKVVEVDEKPLLVELRQRTLSILVVSLIFLLIGVSYAVRRTIVATLKKLQKMAEKAEDGLIEIDEGAFGDDEVGALAKSLKSMANKERNYLRKLNQQVSELEALYNMSRLSQLDISEDQLLSLILQNAIKVFPAQAGAIFFIPDREDEKQKPVFCQNCSWQQEGCETLLNLIQLKEKAVVGLTSTMIETGVVSGLEELAKKSIQTKELEIISFSGQAKGGRGSNYKFKLVAFPIILDEAKVLGATAIVLDSNNSFTNLRFLETINGDLAVIVHRMHLMKDVQSAYLAAIKSLTSALEAKDTYTAGHSERVANYAQMMAENLHLPKEEIQIIKEAAYLHDIGKIGLDDSILTKPGKLSGKEHYQVELHSTYSAQIVEKASFLKKAVPIVLYHHEGYDGGGYPEKLKGEQIPLGARILAICDAFDAMTSDRPYRRALSVEETLTELKRQSGRQFDPGLVKIFVWLISAQKNNLRSGGREESQESLIFRN